MNPFALSCLITADLTVILGGIILIKNPRNKTNLSWFFVSVSVFLWTIGLFGTVIANNKEIALFWQRILYIGTILIPIFFFHFCITLLKQEHKQRKKILAGEVLAALFIILIFSKLFIVDIIERTELGYWPVETGFFYWPFLIYFTFYVIYSLILLRAHSKKHSGIYQKQIQFIYYAALIGFVGGSTNFLLDFDVSFYPFGNFFVSLYVVIVAYAIFKYHLMNIKVIATELLVGLVSIVLFIELILSKSIPMAILKLGILIAFVYLGISLIKSVLKEIKRREKLETLTLQLEYANTKLKKLDKAKSEFISIASHQLRTPLTAIKGYISMFLEGTYGKLRNEEKRPMENVYQSNERLIKLVNDLLSISRVESGKLEMEWGKTDLEEVIKSLINELKIEAEKKKLYVKRKKPTKPLPKINLDRDKIRQVFLNIIDNAIRYTKKGGITIESKTNKTKITIIISDTGEGMTGEETDQLFESFSRGKAGNRMWTEGAGLGLYIAKKFTQMHKGKIWAESKGKEKGSIFYVELPIIK